MEIRWDGKCSHSHKGMYVCNEETWSSWRKMHLEEGFTKEEILELEKAAGNNVSIRNQKTKVATT